MVKNSPMNSAIDMALKGKKWKIRGLPPHFRRTPRVGSNMQLNPSNVGKAVMAGNINVLVTCRSRVFCKKVASRSGIMGAQREN